MNKDNETGINVSFLQVAENKIVTVKFVRYMASNLVCFKNSSARTSRIIKTRLLQSSVDTVSI